MGCNACFRYVEGVPKRLGAPNLHRATQLRAIRHADYADISALRSLGDELGVNRNWSADQVIEELKRERATVLISEDDGTVHGWLVIWRVPPDEMHVLEIAIGPQYRRQGLGSALLQEAMSAGLRDGAAIALLEVRASNAAAIEMYKKLGYHEVGRRPKYYSDGEDALLMDCNLSESNDMSMKLH